MGDPGATYSYLDCSPSLNFRLRVGAGLELALRERRAFLPPFGGQLQVGYAEISSQISSATSTTSSGDAPRYARTSPAHTHTTSLNRW